MQAVDENELCFPTLFNSSCRKTNHPPSISMLIYFTLSSISVLTIIPNVLLVIAIIHFRKLHSPTNFLLLSLAVSDFLVGFLISFQIMLMDGCWYLGDVLCAMYLFLDYVITAASIGTMVLISVDRYVAVCNPLYYPSKVTAGKSKMCILLCWMCFILYQTLLLKENLQNPGRYKTCYGECVVFLNYFEGFLDLFFSFIGPITVIIVLYSRVFVVAVSQARSMRSQVAAVTLHGSVRFKAKKSEMKAAMILGVVVVVFLLCTCPYFCLTLTTQDTGVSASSVTFLLFYFNSTLNPLIYVLFYPWFRKSVKLILTLQILKPGSWETNVV